MLIRSPAVSVIGDVVKEGELDGTVWRFPVPVSWESVMSSVYVFVIAFGVQLIDELANEIFPPVT